MPIAHNDGVDQQGRDHRDQAVEHQRADPDVIRQHPAGDVPCVARRLEAVRRRSPDAPGQPDGPAEQQRLGIEPARADARDDGREGLQDQDAAGKLELERDVGSVATLPVSAIASANAGLPWRPATKSDAVTLVVLLRRDPQPRQDREHQRVHEHRVRRREEAWRSGWVVCFAVHLGFVWWAALRLDAPATRRRAQWNDPGSAMLFVLVTIAACPSLAAVLLAVDTARSLHGADRWLHLVSFFFAAVIGMTSQVSDVTIQTRAMRRLGLMHGLLSFALNLVVLALAVNVLAASLA